MILFSWVLLLALFSPFPLSFLNPSLLLLILKLLLISVLLLYLVKMERKKKNIEDHVLQHSHLTKRKQPQGGSDRLSQHGLLVTAELQLQAALRTLLCFSVYVCLSSFTCCWSPRKGKGGDEKQSVKEIMQEYFPEPKDMNLKPTESPAEKLKKKILLGW